LIETADSNKQQIRSEPFQRKCYQLSAWRSTRSSWIFD